MNTEQKKAVTEWLGECWHEASEDDYMLCKHCGITFQGEWRDDGGFRHFHAILRQRTFATWSDFGACWERLVEKGQWHKFWGYSYDLWWDDNVDMVIRVYDWNYFHWLLSRTEDGTFLLCNLIAKALKEGVLKNG